MGPGVDPHLYKPSEGDVRQLSRADLILYNGLNLEGKMGDILRQMGGGRPVVAVAESVPPEKLVHPPEFQGHPDPHIWFDVDLWGYTVVPISAAIRRLLPEHGTEIEANTQTLRDELLALDREVAAALQEIVREKRVLVTAHDAFAYFGRRYDTDVVGLQGISTATEAGIEDVLRVVETIVERGVKAIFIESSVPRRTVEAVTEACRARGHDLVIGGELFSDAMGPSGTPEGTYMGMMRHNVKTIVEALR
jgi:manganese/zinc/iron transport system substrate-binding protein